MQVENTVIDMFHLAQEQTQNGKPFDHLTFVAKDEVFDQYGNKSIASVFKIDFIDQELQKVNWDNLSNTGLLNLQWDVDVMNNAGNQLLNAYCAKDGGDANQFCEIAKDVGQSAQSAD